MTQRSNFIVRGGADFSGITKAINKTQTQLSGFQKSISRSMKLISTAIGTIAIGTLVKDSIKAASELESAMTGLESIVSGQGRSINRAKEFINSYVEDGLVPLNNAVTAYKNLVSRGYDDDQIEAVMNRLKDAAAFGRQSSYSLGEAVQTATEGLKNENSVLVDNAGVTKNVSKMWDEYAKSIGKNRNQLTQQEKIQAEVNGIMKETQWQVGDAAKYTETFAGRLSALNKTLTDIKINLGNAFMPIANIALPLLQSLASRIENITAHFAALSQTLFGKSTQVTVKNTEVQTNAISDYGDAVEKAGKQAKNAIAPFDEINKINSSGSGTTTGLSGETNTSLTPVTVEATDKSEAFTYSIEKLQEKIEPTIDALERFKDALKPIGKFTFDNIKSFYHDTLVPIGKWILGEGLPRLLDVTSGLLSSINWDKLSQALRNLNQALTPFAISVGRGLILFIEAMADILKPSLAATSELLAKAINAIAKAIKAIPENVTIALGGAIGGLVTSILSFKTATSIAGIVNKLKDSLETFIITLMVHPWLAVAAGIGAIAGAVLALDKARFKNSDIGKYIESLKKLAENAKEFNDEVDEMLKEHQQKKQSIEAEYGAVSILADKYFNLAEKQGLTNDEQILLKTYAQELIEKIPELSGLIDEQTGAYKGTKDEIKELINTTKEYYLVQAAQESLIEIAKKQYEAEKNLKILEEERSNVVQLLKEKQDELNETLDVGNVRMSTATNEQKEAHQKAMELNQQIAKLTDAQEDLSEQIDDTKKSQQDINKEWDFATDYIATYSKNAKRDMEKVANAVKTAYSDINKEVKNWKLPDLVAAVKVDTSALTKFYQSQTGNNVIEYSKNKFVPNQYASGGLPSTGEMFIAREAGPELVGRIGNSSAVANNDQIVEGITRGVATANAEEVALLKQQNSLLQAILQKTGITTKNIYDAVVAENKTQVKRSGYSPLLA